MQQAKTEILFDHQWTKIAKTRLRTRSGSLLILKKYHRRVDETTMIRIIKDSEVVAKVKVMFLEQSTVSQKQKIAEILEVKIMLNVWNKKW